MKQTITLFLFAISYYPFGAAGQLNYGGRYANFGVDADTRSNYMKYGLLTGIVGSDDWYAPSAMGNNVVDTSRAASYQTLLLGGSNFSFSERMSVPLYSKVGGIAVIRTRNVPWRQKDVRVLCRDCRQDAVRADSRG